MLHSVGFFLLDEADSFNQYKLLKMLIAMLSGSNQSLLNRDANAVEKLLQSLQSNHVVHEMPFILMVAYRGVQRGSCALFLHLLDGHPPLCVAGGMIS